MMRKRSPLWRKKWKPLKTTGNHWHPLEHIGTQVPLEPTGTHWNLLVFTGPIGTHQNLLEAEAPPSHGDAALDWNHFKGTRETSI